MLREGLKLARKLGGTAPLSSSVLQEISPGSSVQSDDDWDSWAAQNFGTEFHPCCSCAMLPQDMGGVVDANLKVYGLGKLIPSSSYTRKQADSDHLLQQMFAWRMHLSIPYNSLLM